MARTGCQPGEEGRATAAVGQLADIRFRTLLGVEAWSRLPPAVRNRFSKRLRPGAAITYSGEIRLCRMSRAGWLLAQIARLIGAPLPLCRDSGLAAVVTVTEDARSGGQVWSRLYARPSGFPQVIHSAKRFAGPTGLEEYLGLGFGIALTVHGRAGGIRFLGDHYFLRIGSGQYALRLRIPGWIGPGALQIDHIDRGESCFDFVLTLRHPWFGEMIHQIGHFRDGATLELEPEE